ncbi:MAG: methyl-accepting chemotaxis protein, partial [Burkholderiales bacterium]|nr:methyl-accepting chemotaxis protein [Burkholderiales bacterium]
MNKLLGNMRLATKFSILGVLGALLVAASLVPYVRQSMQDIAVASREQSGIEPVKQLLRVVQLVQQHRGLSSVALGGDSGAEPQRAAKQQEIERAFADLDRSLAALRIDAGVSGAVRKTAGQWQSLVGSVANRSISGKESYVQHTALVADYLLVLDGMLDDFALSLHPEEQGYHLIMAVLVHLPNLTETLGQLRARGALHLAQKTISPEERTGMAGLVDGTARASATMARSLAKTMSRDQVLQDRLGGMVRESESLARQVGKLAREAIVEATELTYAAGEYFKLVTQAIDGQYALMASAMEALDQLLIADIAAKQRAQLAMLGAIVAVVLIVVLLGVAITRSVTGPMRRAVEAASRLGEGDLTVVIDAERKDETGQLLAAMKATVERLRDTIGQVQAAAQQLASASAQVSSTSQSMSQAATEQAASIEETSASLEQMTASISQNTENAKVTDGMAAKAAKEAKEGGEAVRQTVEAMKRIADRISIIDDIAY